MGIKRHKPNEIIQQLNVRFSDFSVVKHFLICRPKLGCTVMMAINHNDFQL